MPATLKLTHKAIGAEVRRGTYDVVVDGERAGSVEMNHTIEIPVEPGRHTLQVRNGGNSSSTQIFDAAGEEIVAFRCTGKRLLPIFLASFVVPRLALNSFAIEPASPSRRSTGHHDPDPARSRPGSDLVKEHGRAPAQDARLLAGDEASERLDRSCFSSL
jgi:hypothetical protein